MAKVKKGLADTGEGEFILNESGTSVTTDKVDTEPSLEEEAQSQAEEEDKNEASTE